MAYLCKKCGKPGHRKQGTRLVDMTCNCGGKFYMPVARKGYGYMKSINGCIIKKEKENETYQDMIGEWFRGVGTIFPFVTAWGPLTARVWNCKKHTWEIEINKQMIALREKYNKEHGYEGHDGSDTPAGLRQKEWLEARWYGEKEK